MRLAEYTDYTLRVLMYCAARPQRLVTVDTSAVHHHADKEVDLLRALIESLTGWMAARLLGDAKLDRIGSAMRARRGAIEPTGPPDASPA